MKFWSVPAKSGQSVSEFPGPVAAKDDDANESGHREVQMTMMVTPNDPRFLRRRLSLFASGRPVWMSWHDQLSLAP